MMVMDVGTIELLGCVAPNMQCWHGGSAAG